MYVEGLPVSDMAGMALESPPLLVDDAAVLLREAVVAVLTLRAANVSELAFRFRRVDVGKWWE